MERTSGASRSRAARGHRDALAKPKKSRQFRGGAPGPRPAPPCPSEPRENRPRFVPKSFYVFLSLARRICPAHQISRRDDRSTAQTTLKKDMHTRHATQGPTHPSTNTQDHAKHRASFRRQQATRLPRLSSAVEHPSRECTNTHELAVGSRLRGGASLAQKLSLGCPRAPTFVSTYGTASHDIKHKVSYILVHTRYST